MPGYSCSVSDTVTILRFISEYRASYPGKNVIVEGAPILVDGVRQWVVFDDLEANDDDFVRIGDDFRNSGHGKIRSGKIGLADCLLISQREIVDFGVSWMEKNRRAR
jgi:aminoglycoside 3-N-acetyltransferase